MVRRKPDRHDLATTISAPRAKVQPKLSRSRPASLGPPRELKVNCAGIIEGKLCRYHAGARCAALGCLMLSWSCWVSSEMALKSRELRARQRVRKKVRKLAFEILYTEHKLLCYEGWVEG